MIRNDNNNDKENKMIQPNGYRFRVYKFNKSTYDAFYNDKTLQGCIDYMRRWNPNQMHNWFIMDEDSSTKFAMHRHEDRLIVV